MDLVATWVGFRYWSKLYAAKTQPTQKLQGQGHDFFMLEFYVQSF